MKIALLILPLLLILLVLALGLVPDPSGQALAEDAMPADALGEAIDYKDGDVALRGWLQRPAGTATGERRPGVLVCHAWRGHDEFVRKVAARMARDGHVAFALDMYGTGVLARDHIEARALSTPFKEDPALMRRRVRAGLEVLRNRSDVDPMQIVAIGFCFGGTTVLELARDGADVAGVVSFHGGLKTTRPAEKGAIRARILVCHGGDDPFVPADEVQGLWSELRAAGADHQILVLSGAVHSFTDPDAGDDPSKGAAFNAVAAGRAWGAADRFIANCVEDAD